MKPGLKNQGIPVFGMNNLKSHLKEFFLDLKGMERNRTNSYSVLE
jgi:hypothetical protein